MTFMDVRAARKERFVYLTARDLGPQLGQHPGPEICSLEMRLLPKSVDSAAH
jgi:hypothetical protein